MENKTSKRRIITLSDQTGSLDVKMWESHVNNVTSQNDVTTICFTVDVYMGRVSLNSNTSTTLQVWNYEIQNFKILWTFHFHNIQLTIKKVLKLIILVFKLRSHPRYQITSRNHWYVTTHLSMKIYILCFFFRNY